MVPYHRPIPDRKQRGNSGAAPESGKSSGGLGGMMAAWVQAEKLMQIALMLPCAGFIGWLAGYGLDRWLHQAWIGMAGAVFGIVAGLVGAIRMAMAWGADPEMNEADENGDGARKSGKRGDSGPAQ